MDPRLFSAKEIKKLDIKLGKGSYGNVCLAKFVETGKEVAVKEFPLRQSIDYDHYNRELAALIHFSKLQLQQKESINIVKFYGLLNDGTKDLIPFVFQLYMCSLEDYVHNNNPGINLQFQFAYDVINGIYHMHKENFLHRDIKPKNILIDDDLHAYLCDFGTAIQVKNLSNGYKPEPVRDGYTAIPVTTSYCVAPELWENNFYSTKTDIFAFSVTFYELTSSKYFYAGPSDTWESQSKNKVKPEFTKEHLKFFEDLARKTWHDDPNQRPEAEEIRSQLKEEMVRNEMKRLSL